jgi:hypothetical protein
MRGLSPAAVWAVLLLGLLWLLVVIPWAMFHAPRHEHHRFGESESPAVR